MPRCSCRLILFWEHPVDPDQTSCCLCVVKQFLGELWVQNVILMVSAFIGILTIASSSRNEKRRATVDMVRDQTTDARLKAAREKFRSLRAKNADFVTLLADQSSADFLDVREVLNAYEFMAAGVREKAFDENTYKRMYFYNVVTDWPLLENFIKRYREIKNSETLYQEFQLLAAHWKKHPLRAGTKSPVSPPASSPLSPQPPSAPPASSSPASAPH